MERVLPAPWDGTKSRRCSSSSVTAIRLSTLLHALSLTIMRMDKNSYSFPPSSRSLGVAALWGTGREKRKETCSLAPLGLERAFLKNAA